jgi:hypothetical protein
MLKVSRGRHRHSFFFLSEARLRAPKGNFEENDEGFAKLNV